MNLKRIDAAVSAYASHLDEGDNARLAFFRKLWGVMDEAAKEADGDGTAAYAVPAADVLAYARREGAPVLSLAPAAIETVRLARVAKRLAECMAENGGYTESVREGLLSRRWDRLVAASDAAGAGKEPEAYLSRFCELLGDDGLDERTARLGTLACSLALRALLEGPAASICSALEKSAEEEMPPVKCPVCGGAAGVARVGVTKRSDGRGKELWCPQCGATWEFERVRCARCGTQNQSHLHYFNLEGDDAHRLATCDECGGFVRTVYQEDALAPFSFEVEDVVMAKLDLVALRHVSSE